MRALMLALVLVFLPYLLDLPFWIALLSLGLVGWRWMNLHRGWPMLSLPMMFLVVVAAGVGVWQEFGTVVGRDGGVSVLLVLLGLKLNESRKTRDALLLVLMSFFTLVAFYFFRQDVLTLIYTLGVATLLFAVVVYWRKGRGALPDQLKRIFPLLLRALPFTLVLFVVFPRPDAPLWAMPAQSQNSESGLADEITPGSVSSVAKSETVAFRVEFLDPPPPRAQLYWRGPVFEAFDGRNWTQRSVWTGFTPNTRIESRGRVIRYRSTVEPHGRMWVLALDRFAGTTSSVRLSSNYQVVTRPFVVRQRFELQADTEAIIGREESRGVLQYNLLLPGQNNPRARALAASWQDLPPAERVRAGMEFFSSGGFIYTLNPPVLESPDPMDELLYQTRQGFCEHYAGAFAFLMRAAGVPARVVGGYLGGDLNGSAGYTIVRQSEAHAWVEVWLEGQGWVRVDPTAAVSPARLTEGLAASLQAPADLSPLTRGEQTWLTRAQLQLDAFQFAWDQWVIGYNGTQQRLLLSLLGAHKAVVALIVVVLLALTLLPILLRRTVRATHQTSDELRRLYQQFIRRFSIQPELSEPVSQYVQRLARAHPEQAEDIEGILETYQDLRYGPEATPEQVKGFRQQVQGFRLRK
ncbi:transglutaminase TgpA family protein [Deinococcus cellulosilyticus]|uniref:Transglutaminase-like domain-containing protein n=1 Tax=Deinococcus cellulosilyticus (strain DSM 18568 / NBRC 106333 / KACC 11606 / 5516J-15) TaxID=1223518 RepID=A0A511MVZ8_DEIC1|nr:DUF3488 and transglutaminase-like domain-containing protein [Deinococcus cellulosilyticus]GEM44752.1 hypothetical protein DC3_03870 [Deinococcus cellulosilyticus NBRC 106333 = KACC 11606]